MGDYGVGLSGLPGTKDLVWRNASSGLFTDPFEPSPNPSDWTIVGPR